MLHQKLDHFIHVDKEFMNPPNPAPLETPYTGVLMDTGTAYPFIVPIIIDTYTAVLNIPMTEPVSTGPVPIKIGNVDYMSLA